MSVKNEIIYGVHPVYEALSAARRIVYEIFIEKGKVSKRHKKIAVLAKSKSITLNQIGAAQFKSMLGKHIHQGVAARVSPYPLAEVPDIINNIPPAGSGPVLLLLDSIQDSHNFGAIIRTAVCAGVDGVVIPKDRSVPPAPAVSKISAGALEHVRLAVVNNLVRTLQMLKDYGLWIFGLDQTAAQTIYSSDFSGPLGLVIGGEQKGIRSLVKRNCDFLISIPQTGSISSLNASVAAAVVMYEVFRQRQI
jgi:23S rRNA (guanosine2251-2'-O)-methyltransferase